MNSPSPPEPKKIVQRTAVSEAALPGISPVLERVYRNRGVTTVSELDYSLNNLYRPQRLKNIDEAVACIQEAVKADANILIAGDFDADGATSCALAYLALSAFGARKVSFVCPNRHEFGYGLSRRFVEYFAESQPDLVITVDNGITSIEGVKIAKEYGITVVITDHHLPGDELPDADAIVNPRLPGDEFQSKNLAGVGVIFYVLSMVRKALIEDGWFESEGIAVPNMADYLDLVALGTIADVVPLDYNNRILVENGLQRINSGKCRPGIRVLLQAGRRKIGEIIADDLAFAAAPRLNAAGRLSDMGVGIACLIEKDSNKIIERIDELEELNTERRSRESKSVNEAMRVVDNLKLNDDGERFSNCLFDEKWELGIIGLIAARIRERTGRPTIAFSQNADGDLQGSARSNKNINIRDAIAEVDARAPNVIVKYGGHAMAAGLTISKHSFEQFTSTFEEVIAQLQNQVPIQDQILTDGEIEFIDIPTAQALRDGGPWGQGFEKPVFEGNFTVLEYEVMKEIHLRMRVRSLRHNKVVNAVYFFYFRHYPDPPELTEYKMVFQLETNEYNGKAFMQLKIEYMELCT